MGALKRNALEFGLVGALSIITLLLAGNGGGDDEPIDFDHCPITLVSTSTEPCIPTR